MPTFDNYVAGGGGLPPGYQRPGPRSRRPGNGGAGGQQELMDTGVWRGGADQGATRPPVPIQAIPPNQLPPRQTTSKPPPAAPAVAVRPPAPARSGANAPGLTSRQRRLRKAGRDKPVPSAGEQANALERII